MSNFLMTPQERLFQGTEQFLKAMGCTVTSLYKNGEYIIHYTLSLDVKPQPAIRVTNKPSLIIPKGSLVAVVAALGGYSDEA